MPLDEELDASPEAPVLLEAARARSGIRGPVCFRGCLVGCTSDRRSTDQRKRGDDYPEGNDPFHLYLPHFDVIVWR